MSGHMLHQNGAVYSWPDDKRQRGEVVVCGTGVCLEGEARQNGVATDPLLLHKPGDRVEWNGTTYIITRFVKGMSYFGPSGVWQMYNFLGIPEDQASVTKWDGKIMVRPRRAWWEHLLIWLGIIRD